VAVTAATNADAYAGSVDTDARATMTMTMPVTPPLVIIGIAAQHVRCSRREQQRQPEAKLKACS
jgi:hypothetical protein